MCSTGISQQTSAEHCDSNALEHRDSNAIPETGDVKDPPPEMSARVRKRAEKAAAAALAAANGVDAEAVAPLQPEKSSNVPNRDAFQRMSYLYQAARHMMLLPIPNASLASFYVHEMKTIAKRLGIPMLIN